MTTPWLTFKEAAQYLRLGTRTLERYIAEREVPCHYVGSAARPKRLFHKDELDEWVKKQNQ